MNDVQVKRTGRKKGSVSVDAKKARKIALAKVNRKGRTNAQIAREVGVCTAVVDRADVHPLIGPLIKRLKAKSEAQLERIWDKSVTSLEDDLDQIKTLDPLTRLRTRKQALQFVEAGEQPQSLQQPAGGGDFTLEQLLVVIHRETARGDDDGE